jgi:hypothetical protein
MMIKDNGDIESESDRSDCEGMPPLEVSWCEPRDQVVTQRQQFPESQVNQVW